MHCWNNDGLVFCASTPVINVGRIVVVATTKIKAKVINASSMLYVKPVCFVKICIRISAFGLVK